MADCALHHAKPSRAARHLPLRRAWWLSSFLCAATMLSSACAVHRGRASSVNSQEQLAALIEADSETLPDYSQRVRALAAEARPPRNDAAQTVETWDALLAVALAELGASPTPGALRQVANEYRRL